MKRVGLFVGVDRYKDTGISQLRCAVKDAMTLMASFSKAQYDSVDSLLNDDAHCENILDRAESIIRDLNPGDLFVFYFSGHGREFSNTHYLIGPTGRANMELYQRGSLSLPELISVTNKPGINRLFILDCCRCNILADRSGAYVCEDARDIALNAAVRKSSNANIIPPLILNSCSTGQRAFEGKEHGYFTEILLKSIARGDIASFQDFQRSLTITGTPTPQNISWNGDLSHWKNIVLFKHWNSSGQKQITVEPEETISSETKTDHNLYIWEDLNLEVKELLPQLNKVDKELQKVLNRAERAGNSQDYSSAVYFLEQAKQMINERLNPLEYLSVPADTVSQEWKYSKFEDGHFRLTGHYWCVWNMILDVLKKMNKKILRKDLEKGIIITGGAFSSSYVDVLFYSSGNEIEVKFITLATDLLFDSKKLIAREQKLFSEYVEQFIELGEREYLKTMPEEMSFIMPPPKAKHEGASVAEFAKLCSILAWFNINPLFTPLNYIYISRIKAKMKKYGNYDGMKYLKRIALLTTVYLVLWIGFGVAIAIIACTGL